MFDIKEKMSIEKIFTFSFIRNPWDLVISKYFAPFYRSINFLSGKELLYFLEKYWPAPNEAGDSFFDYFDPEEMSFIGRFESREKDLRHISKSIGIDLDARCLSEFELIAELLIYMLFLSL